VFKQTNHANVYELLFEEPTKFNFTTLLTKIDDLIKAGKDAETYGGTYYIKSHQSLKDTEVFLFGKDNPDASNHKRVMKKLEFEKVDIDVGKEVLTDFIHLSIAKKYHHRNGKSVHTLLMEKSPLIRSASFKYFIDYVTSNAFATSLQKRVINEFYTSVKEAKKIIKITQTKTDVDLPLPKKKNSDNPILADDIEVSEELIYQTKKRKRGLSLPFSLFESLYSTFDIKDPTTKLHVTIADKNNDKINIDFSDSAAPYAVKYDIPVNRKEDDIQEDIANQMNRLIDLYDRGQI
jgi:hypothetical protein